MTKCHILLDPEENLGADFYSKVPTLTDFAPGTRRGRVMRMKEKSPSVLLVNVPPMMPLETSLEEKITGQQKQ